ncbi:MAG: GntR family transcriptional regulator [Alkaliphilus sp.]|nr:GntR family transcriptional regulator [bacterium AH-315-L21]MBN4056640.1 GntR family transcriptional regulator [bacterium AH-315-K05]MBN4062881.1 GntR family transcriptional regulator [Alkaliphilus sp. AH-315-G20]PHS29840.1 MAG: GntR family transcriptional regulator [Alkaliphilus sp.]
MLDKNNHIPLYAQLKDIIVKKIKTDEWKISSQIPTEKEFMEEYSVGRATVRKSISMLENEGYIYKKRGIGTFVARKQPVVGFGPIISLTASLEARGIETENVIISKGIIIPDEKLLRTMKWKNEKNCYWLKRIRKMDEKSLAIEKSYFVEEFKIVEGKHDLTRSIAKILLEDLRLTIKKIEQIVISRMPTKEEQEDLNIDSETLLLEIERWIYIEGTEEPYYYLNFVILGEVYNLAV